MQTDLEIFDSVVNHLLSQNEKSMGYNNTFCAYRGKDDRKCAIGFLISDDLYSTDIENTEAYVDAVIEVVYKSNPSWNNDLSFFNGVSYPNPVEGKSYHMLIALQRLHDYSDPDEWASVSSFIKNSIFENGELKEEKFLQNFGCQYFTLLDLHKKDTQRKKESHAVQN